MSLIVLYLIAEIQAYIKNSLDKIDFYFFFFEISTTFFPTEYNFFPKSYVVMWFLSPLLM